MEQFIGKMMRRCMIFDFYEDLDEYFEDLDDMEDGTDDLEYLEEFEKSYY